MTIFACAASTVFSAFFTGAAIAITGVNAYLIFRSNATIRELRDAGVLPSRRRGRRSIRENDQECSQ